MAEPLDQCLLTFGTRDSSQGIVLYTAMGFLSSPDWAIARKIAAFLSTRVIVGSAVTNTGEAFRILSGEELGPELEVEDFYATSESQSGATPYVPI